MELAPGATLYSQVSINNVVNAAILGKDRTTSRIRGAIRIRDSHKVRMRDFDQEGDGQGYFDSSDITIVGVTIRQPPHHHGEGSAIWFNDCKDVQVSDSNLSSNDDVFCLKHSGENIHLRNTVLTGKLAAAYKIGTESEGRFHDVSMKHCTIQQSDRGAVSIESVDGAEIDGVDISDIRMIDVAAPFFIRLGHRARYGEKIGSIRNVHLENIQAAGLNSDEGIGSSIAGLAGHPIENLSIVNFRATYRGGGTTADAEREIAEFPAAYPEYDMFGRLPSYALYIRHASGIILRDVSLGFSQADARPALIAQDVLGLTLDGFSAMTGTSAAVRVIDSKGVRVRRSPSLPAVLPQSSSAIALPARQRSPVTGASVWIDSNGNGKLDAGEQLFPSLLRAFAAAKAGDCIVVGPGIYDINLSELPLQVKNPGIRLKSAEGPESTIIQVTGADSRKEKAHSLFYVTADSFTVEGLTLRGGAYGVLVENASGTIIRDCFFDGSKRNSIGLIHADGTRILNNRLRGSGVGSVSIAASRDCVVERNLFFEDTAGITTLDSDRNRFIANSFRAPSWYGLSFTNSHGNRIENNVVDGSRLSGLQLRSSNDNQVTGNTLTNNKTEGLLIDGSSRNNIIRGNDIHGNKGLGIANESPDPAEAPSNWWGSTAGPQAAVAGNVIFSPWLVQPLPRTR